MQRLLKFLHVLGAMGTVGTLATQWAIVSFAGPPEAAPSAPQIAIDVATRYVMGPSLALMLLSGMLLIMVRPAWFEVRWVWAKILLMMALAPWAWFGMPSPVNRLGALGLALLAVALAMWRPRLGARDTA